MKITMAAGTFDIFHLGHRYFLREAKKKGERLVVVVARDSNVLKSKGKMPLHSEQKRMEGVKKEGIADSVVLGNEANIFSILSEIKPDVICLGYDQKVKEEELRKKLDDMGLAAEIFRIGPHMPDVYKSSLLREKI